MGIGSTLPLEIRRLEAERAEAAVLDERFRQGIVEAGKRAARGETRLGPDPIVAASLERRG